MTNPDADVRLGDVYDFEGDPFSPRRHCDTMAIPAMELDLTGIAQLRSALDKGEAAIREYIARTGGEANAGDGGPEYAQAAAIDGEGSDLD